MNTAHRKPLPGTKLDYFDARGAVEAIKPGAWNTLPYTSRVHAENLVRRCDPALLNDYLKQIIECKRDLDFPWFPARVVCHDILGQTALVDLAGLRDAIADQGGDPAKVNPVVPEVVNQVCFKVIGNDITVTMASEAGQLQLNVMEPVIGQALFESISILTNACYNLLEKCVNGITANRAVCEAYVFNSIGIVTYLNPYIGHHNGDIVGKICAETGKSVREVVLERGLLTESELDDIFSVQNLMYPVYKAKRYTDENEQ